MASGSIVAFQVAMDLRKQSVLIDYVIHAAPQFRVIIGTAKDVIFVSASNVVKRLVYSKRKSFLNAQCVIEDLNIVIHLKLNRVKMRHFK